MLLSDHWHVRLCMLLLWTIFTIWVLFGQRHKDFQLVPDEVKRDTFLLNIIVFRLFYFKFTLMMVFIFCACTFLTAIPILLERNTLKRKIGKVFGDVYKSRDIASALSYLKASASAQKQDAG